MVLTKKLYNFITVVFIHDYLAHTGLNINNILEVTALAYCRRTTAVSRDRKSISLDNAVKRNLTWY